MKNFIQGLLICSGAAGVVALLCAIAYGLHELSGPKLAFGGVVVAVFCLAFLMAAFKQNKRLDDQEDCGAPEGVWPL